MNNLTLGTEKQKKWALKIKDKNIYRLIDALDQLKSDMDFAKYSDDTLLVVEALEGIKFKGKKNVKTKQDLLAVVELVLDNAQKMNTFDWIDFEVSNQNFYCLVAINLPQ